MLRLSRRLAPNRSVAAVAPFSSPRIISRSPFSTHPARPAQSLRSTSAVHTSPSTLALLQTFDVPHSNSTSASLAPHGLFNQPTLLHPTDFVPLAVRTILRAKLIVEKICRPQPTSYGSLEEVERAFLVMVKDLDRLSDRLCGVIDLAELVRNVHPDPEWTTQANEAYEVLCEYMNVLNTHTGLYHVSPLPPPARLTPTRPSNLSIPYYLSTPLPNHLSSTPPAPSPFPSSAISKSQESISLISSVPNSSVFQQISCSSAGSS